MTETTVNNTVEAPELDETLQALQAIATNLAQANRQKNTPSGIINHIQGYLHGLTEKEEYSDIQKDEIREVQGFVNMLASTLIDN